MSNFLVIFLVFIALSQPSYGGEQEKNIESKKEPNKESKAFETFWKSRFRVSNFRDRSAEDTIFSTELYAKLNWHILERFSIHTEGLAVGRNGFTQSIYDRPDRRNGFHFIEGFFKWDASTYLKVKFGNIKQDFLEAPLLVTDKTFPSIIESLSLLNSNTKLSLVFQQAIPSNATESVRREAQIIKTPVFLTASVFLDRENSFYSLKNKLTGFYFSNLSPAVADQSLIYGNTINLQGNDSHFRYKFLGFYNKFYLRMPFSGQWVGEIGGDYIYNVLAPDTFNQGERVYASLFYDFYDLMEIRLQGEYFANQSDTSASYYNSEAYGHNNRVGGGLSLQTYFYKSGLKLGMNYKHTRPINPERSAVGVSNSFVILIGTHYVSI